MLRLSHISKRFEAFEALRAVTLEVPRGSTLALIGPSGSGKSTLLRLMNGLIAPDAGEITLDGVSVRPSDDLALRRRMGYVIQEGGLFPHLTVAGNLALQARHVGWKRPRIEARIRELLPVARLTEDLLTRYPQQLSGGQRQRVSLLRALMLDPELLLLDEPLGALDPMIRADLQDDLREAFQTLGKTVVLVTHDLAEAAFFAERIVLLHEGRIVQDGPFRDLVQRPAEQFVTRFVRAHRSALPALMLVALLLILGLLTPAPAVAAGAALRVGSKTFTESVVLGELLTLLAREAGSAADHRRQLGGTRVLWNALREGQIDAYPEYTGTLTREILAAEGIQSDAALRAALAERGLRMSAPLGFNNTYAIGMQEATAARLGIEALSDLRAHPGLRLAFSNEFMDRADGWPALRQRYALPQRDVNGVEHELAYQGLLGGAIDVTDFYATDAEIAEHAFRILRDDLEHFPAYHAVVLYRADLEERAPAALASMLRLVGRLGQHPMAALNARVKIDRVPEARVAAAFLLDALGVDVEVRVLTRAERLWQRTLEHLFLVAVSLSAAIVVAVPLGVIAARLPRAGQFVLGATGLLWTIPSLALLVFMIPVLGIGEPPAIAALFLYSLLPIVRNTHAGLTGIAPELRESAAALGLSAGTRLRAIELPLASPAILAGIKTSGVINVGTATLGALIGAGGYGQPIITGIRLDSTALILEGAIPAALLAIVVQGLFELAERRLVPRGLRLKG